MKIDVQTAMTTLLIFAWRIVPRGTEAPIRLMLGREIALPIELLFDKSPGSVQHPCNTDYLEWFFDDSEKRFAAAREHLGRAAVQQKMHFESPGLGCISSIFFFF